MKKKAYFVLTLFTVVLSVSHGQGGIQFYVAPHIGGEWTLSAFENKRNRPPYIKGTWPDLSDKYGLSLLVDFKTRFSVELGYGWGNVGGGVTYKSQTDSVLYSTSGGSVSQFTVRRMTVKVNKPVARIEIKRKKEKDSFLGTLLNIKDEFRYWAVFDVQIFSGISYEYIPPYSDEGHLSSLAGIFPNNDEIILDEQFNITNPYGSGLFLGFSIQSYQLGKRKFELGFIYHQGLKRRVWLDWESSINGLEFPVFRTFTRGSMLAMYLSYPIKLFEIKKNKRP